MSSKHIPALDGVRGVAVLLVVLYHVGGGAQSSSLLMRLIGNTVQIGWAGVTLFFILSGFLITGILWDSRGAAHWYKNFYMRRTVRIFPLYYGALLLIVLASIVTHTLPEVAAHIWTFFLYMQNIPPMSHIADTINSPFKLSHFWSLAVEEQFYLVWPFLIARVRSLGQMKFVCVAVFLLSFVFRIWVWHHYGSPGPFSGFLVSRAGELAFGAWLALSYRDASWSKVAPVLTALSPLFLLGFLASCYPDRSFQLWHKWTFTLGLFCITFFWAGVLTTVLRPGILQRAMQAAWLRWIGGISYGLYVYHVLLGGFYHELAAKLVHSGNRNVLLALSAVITIVLSIVIAYLSFRFFESPILKLRQRYQSRPAERVTA